MSDIEDDFVTNESGNTHFAEVVGGLMNRRVVLQGAAVGAAAFVTGAAFASPVSADDDDDDDRDDDDRDDDDHDYDDDDILGSWEAIPTSSADTVVVPAGYTAQVIIPWGDPINPSGPAFKQDGSNTAEEQEQQLGMGHDGIHYFPLGRRPSRGGRRGRNRGSRGRSNRAGNFSGLLALNHEYTVDAQLFPDGTDNWDAEKTRKGQAGHGVSIVQVEKNRDGSWSHVESRYARRFTANTPTALSGPAAGHRLVQTEADPDGMTPLGIINQCGNGYTPWGTYLTTEENFNGYFWEESEGTAPGITEEQAAINARYGVTGRGFGYLWASTDDRFRADLNPQEPNRFGWMVEIDPYDRKSTAMKRTAMGRFKHEGAAFTTGHGGRAVVYMGDDQRFDYIYKFVSDRNWRREIRQHRSPLDHGTLYVARFDEDGTGEWLRLVHGEGPLTAANGFGDQGEVLIKTRMAADLLGATPMDRPEWTTVHPETGDVFCTLTNNTRRTEPNAANPRFPNLWGHIVKWSEKDPTSETFEWDVFLFAGPGDGVDGSTIDAEDQFGSPDGLWIDDNGRLWIQTDGDQPDGSNNQMLLADPETAELKRFLVGPVDCEVTGVTMTPNNKTMFVDIQHPGDGGPAEDPTQTSTWPDGPGVAGRPRPATVVIQKEDGGVIGT